MRAGMIAGFALVVVGACSGQASHPVTTTAPPRSGDLRDPVLGTVTVDGVPLLVAVVDTPSGRGQGLRGVTDLGDLDGMLFSWGGSDTTSRFTMEDTLIPLDIMFFAADGRWVGTVRMQPCRTPPCPLYSAPGSYAYALEVPASSSVATGPGSTMLFGDGH